MSEKRIGTLIYDPSMGRYDIRFGIESYYGGLHCGDCFDVKVRDVWIPVRIEMDENWYLVGLSKTRLGGLTVQIWGVFWNVCMKYMERMGSCCLKGKSCQIQ